MAGGGNQRKLDQTPTWAVASVCAIIIIVSILLEKGLHYVGQWFTKRRKKALFEALEKVKAELMVLGFISLLLTFGQTYIAKICIPAKAANTMLPCKLSEAAEEAEGRGSQKRRLLWNAITDSNSTRRVLAEAAANTCAKGKVPLVSVNGLHQLHMFIFFLAIIHVVYSALTMFFGRAKIRRWKEWEKETLSIEYEFLNDPSRFRFSHETSFVKQHTNFWNRIPVLLYVVSFFRQFFRSVRKEDYLAMRHGFINVHLAPGSKFNFQKYIMRSLEDDFKVVVGISPVLWASAVLFLLFNVHGIQELFWMTLVPPIIILAVGTKLQAIISKMAIEIKERHAVVQGIPLVQVGDSHFWFRRPHLVLTLIHFTLFQNAFQITYFFWIWYDFGLRSCFHDNFKLIIGRVCIGIAVQFLCSYITLPLYALVSQMGSHMKKSIFDEQTSRALKKWHQAVKKRHKKGLSQSNSITPTTASPRSSPGASPLHHLYDYQNIAQSTSARTSINLSPPRQLHRAQTVGHSDRTLASRISYYSDQEVSDAEPDNTSPNLISFKYNEIESSSDPVEEHCVTVEEEQTQQATTTTKATTTTVGKQTCEEDFSFMKSGEEV
ncbi:MLO-like protein 9 [Iris pallida]|uniref:MLO-like protein n=1 Tax=Iris pallida TaxID=29817 RepID=A0AAX6DK66_IRIPA|nr:MLO-like protein 9 [Iris pallida]